jgi:pilus assembly protein CpaB
MDRQKIIVLMGAAWLSAGLLTWFLYAKAVAPQTEKTVRVVIATHDMLVGTRLQSSDVKVVNYPERVLPKHAVYDAKFAVDYALLAPINANEPLTSDKLSSTKNVEGIAAVIKPGYRAVSVPTTDVSGVAGLIQPRSKVDVLFTRPGSMAEATTSTILQNIEVLSIGKTVQAGQAADTKAATKSPVVTLLLTPLDAQKVELAKNQGRISLSLRNPTDPSADVSTEPITTEVLDPMISARLARARRGRTTALGRANLEDPNVWQELTGEKKPVDPRKLAADEEARRKKADAERPKAVVDVFRGDKHTQETFK